MVALALAVALCLDEFVPLSIPSDFKSTKKDFCLAKFHYSYTLKRVDLADKCTLFKGTLQLRSEHAESIL